MKNANKKNILLKRSITRNYRITLFILGFVSFLFNSCDPDFTKSVVDPVYAIETNNHFSTGTTSGEISVNIPGIGSRPYTVMVYPRWMVIKKHEGKLINDAATIPFEFEGVENFVYNGRVLGNVYVKVDGAGVFLITVTYGTDPVEYPDPDGQTPMYCSTAEINFGFQAVSDFFIANNGSITKNWHIENIPSWLKLSSTNGNLQPIQTLVINCTVNREGLAPGTYSQIIYVESDNPQLSHGILVKMEVFDLGPRVNTAKIKWIEGTVQDAFYHKGADVLYILTESPNNLLVKTAQSDSLMAYPLDRVPNCIDVTADGKTIAIGYNQAYVDLLNAETLQRIKLYQTDCVPFDIVFGENGWCYIAPKSDQWVYFYSLNLTSGVTFHNSNLYTFYEKSVLKKMPGKPLIYSTCQSSYPSGLQIINIAGGRANDTIPKWHEELAANLWFTDDGTKIIAGDKEIHNIPAYTTEPYFHDLPEITIFNIPENLIQSLDYNSKLQCFFAVGTDGIRVPENSDAIYQVNEINYNPEKMVKVTPFPGVVNGIAYPDMDVAHIFSNTAGTKLMAVKTVKTDSYLNVWALELFDLPLQ